MPFLIKPWSLPRSVPVFRVEPDPPPFIERARREPYPLCYPWDNDVEVPADAFPTSAREVNAFRVLPDFLSLKYWPAVSAEFRAIVEDLEPGVHQFSEEIPIFYKTGKRVERHYYCLNIRGYLDNTIIRELSTIRRMRNGAPDPKVRHEELVLDETSIGERHLWRATDMHKKWFISDEMARRIAGAKIGNLDVQRHMSGTRREVG